MYNPVEDGVIKLPQAMCGRPNKAGRPQNCRRLCTSQHSWDVKLLKAMYNPVEDGVIKLPHAMCGRLSKAGRPQN